MRLTIWQASSAVAIGLLVGVLALAIRGEPRPTGAAAPLAAAGPFVDAMLPKADVKPQPIKRVSMAHEAIALAIADLQTISEDRWPYQRWIWEQEPTLDLVKGDRLTLNYISRANVLLRDALPVLANGHLIRVDLAMLAAPNDPKSLKEITDAWEQLRYDPAFTLNLTAGTILTASSDLPPVRVLTAGKWAEMPAAQYVDPETGEVSLDVVRFDSPALDLDAAWELQEAVLSQAPVVEANYFTWRALTSIQDDGAWRLIYSGLYLDFIGVKESTAKGKSDLAVFLEGLGVPDDAIFRALTGRLRGIQISDVTGKVRQWELLWGRNTNPKAGISLIGITRDVRDRSIATRQNARLNLLDFEADALEVMFTRDSGIIGGVLFDGQGKLQREAPVDVVVNRMVPEPHSPRLEGAIACIQCHVARGDDGWKPLRNDLTLTRKVVDVFGDLRADSGTLAGLYVGSPDKSLRRAREDQQEAALRIVDGFGRDNLKVARDAALIVSDRYTAHRYANVDAESMLAMCGLRAPKEKAVELFSRLAAPTGESGMMGVLLEDARIGTLRAGGSITRTEADAVRSICAARVRAAMELPAPKEIP